MNPDYLDEILTAQVYDVAVETPLEYAPRLSARIKNKISFKREDLQPIFSFKIRGAYNKLAKLSAAERGRGIICSSAGNHAQGVSLAASKFMVRAVVVMPVTTPAIKIDAVRELGGEVVLHGTTYDDAYEKAIKLADENGLIFIHPFDDPDVIAGQGTIGVEINKQHADPVDAVFVPIGGGGLISGIAEALNQISPGTRVIGVEPEESASMSAAIAAGHPVTLDHVGIFADGVAVRRVGDETFRICNERVDEIVLVNTDEICAAVQDIFEDTRVIVEPAGALAVAGLKRWVTDNGVSDKSLVAVNGGANVNFDRLRHIAERAALGEQREALYAVEIPEQKGSFLSFCKVLGERNVTEFNYRCGDHQTARIFVGVQLRQGGAERRSVLGELKQSGYNAIDLSDDEMAKLHVRHMVGGKAPGIENERLYRFEFPERPGALLAFLTAVGNRWNISLFHYRNHGSDYGRVLTGIQVANSERSEFDQYLTDLGYPFWDESDNPAYQMFLA
jgi:threonine dehydratase